MPRRRRTVAERERDARMAAYYQARRARASQDLASRIREIGFNMRRIQK